MMPPKPSYEQRFRFGQRRGRRTARNDRDVRETTHFGRQRSNPGDDETVSRPQRGPTWAHELDLVRGASEHVVGVP